MGFGAYQFRKARSQTKLNVLRQQDAEEAVGVARAEHVLRLAGQAGHGNEALVHGIALVGSHADEPSKLPPSAIEALTGALMTGKSSQILHGHTGGVKAASFSPDGERAATASSDGTARIWDLTKRRSLFTLSEPGAALVPAAIEALVFSKDGALLLTGGASGARLWDAKTGKLAFKLEGEIGAAGAVGFAGAAAFSPDGKRALTGSRDHVARLWDTATGKLVVALEGHSEAVTTVAFSPDGAAMATGSADHSVRVWNAEGQLLFVLEGHGEEALRAVAFSPDSAILACAGADGKLRLWGAKDGALRTTLQEPDAPASAITSAAFSPDGARVVTAHADGAARVWSVGEGKLAASAARPREPGDVGLVLARRIAGGDGRRRSHGAPLVRGGRSPLATLRGHFDAVTSASFSPDGARLLTAGEDRTARLWDARDRRQLLLLHGHAQGVNAVAYSPTARGSPPPATTGPRGSGTPRTANRWRCSPATGSACTRRRSCSITSTCSPRATTRRPASSSSTATARGTPRTRASSRCSRATPISSASWPSRRAPRAS